MVQKWQLFTPSECIILLCCTAFKDETIERLKLWHLLLW